MSFDIISQINEFNNSNFDHDIRGDEKKSKIKELCKNILADKDIKHLGDIGSVVSHISNLSDRQAICSRLAKKIIAQEQAPSPKDLGVEFDAFQKLTDQEKIEISLMIPKESRISIVEHTQKLVSDDMESPDIIKCLLGIQGIDENKRAPFVRVVKEMFEGRDKSVFIEDCGRIFSVINEDLFLKLFKKSPETISSFAKYPKEMMAEAALQLSKLFESTGKSAGVMEIFAKFPQTNLENAVAQLTKLKGQEIVNIIYAFSDYPPDTKMDVALSQISTLFVPETKEAHKITIIQKFAKCPQKDLSVVVSHLSKPHVLQFLDIPPTNFAKTALLLSKLGYDYIEFFAKISEEEREEFVNQAGALTKGMFPFDKRIAINNLAKESDRADFINQAMTLIEGMTGNNRGEALDKLNKVPRDKWADFINQVNTMSQGRNEEDKLSIIMVLVMGKSAEGIEHAVKFLRGHPQKSWALSQLLKIPQKEREDFANHTALLGENLSKEYKTGMVEAFVKIPQKEREDFVKQATLLCQGSSESDKLGRIKVLAGIPPGKRDDFVKQAVALTDGMVQEKLDSILALSKIPDTYWMAVNEHVSQLLNQITGLNKTSNMIKMFCLYDQLNPKAKEFAKFTDFLTSIKENIKKDLNDKYRQVFSPLVSLLERKITSEQIDFFIGEGYLKSYVNYTDPDGGRRLSPLMADLVKHKGIVQEISNGKLLPHTKVPMLLLVALRAKGIQLETCQELIKGVQAQTQTFKDGNKLRTLVNGISAVLNSSKLSTEDKEFLLSKIKLQDRVALKTAFSTLQGIIGFESMDKMDALSKANLEKKTLNEILYETIRALLPMKPIENFQEKFFNCFVTSRSPNFLMTYAAKLNSQPDSFELLRYLGGIVDEVLAGNYPASRYDLQGEHVKTIFTGREALFEEWKKGEKANLGDFLLQTDPELDQKLPFEEQKKLLKEKMEELGKKSPDFEEIREKFESLIQKNEALKSFNRFTIEDTDHYIDLFLVGKEGGSSCQAVDGEAKWNKCLMGYVGDGKIRLLAIKDSDGKIIARQIMRVLWDGEKPVLFIEQMYPKVVNPKYKEAMELFAKERARKLGLPLLLRDDKSTLPLYGKPVFSLGSPARYEYSDSVGSTPEGEACITKGIYTIAEPRLVQ